MTRKSSRLRFVQDTIRAGMSYRLTKKYLTAVCGSIILPVIVLFTNCTDVINVDENDAGVTSAVIAEAAISGNVSGTEKKWILKKKCGLSEVQASTSMMEVESLPATAVSIDSVMNRIRGAVTAGYHAQLTGVIEIDGRNHDVFDNLVGPGIFGVYTSGIVKMYGGAVIGGNGIAPVDRRGLRSVRTLVCRENAPDYFYYSSPEAFLGLDEGGLDAYKISASQFSTPFEGVVYVTEDPGPVNFRNSRGILIVHNELSNAELMINSGEFQGLIICDVMDRTNGYSKILGGVVTLTGDITSRYGNGSTKIHYSSQALEELPSYCDIFTGSY